MRSMPPACDLVRENLTLLSHALGLNTRFSLDDFPASAFHGPYIRMLFHHPGRGVDFIIRLINRACEAFAHPDNRYEHIEPPAVVNLQLSDGVHEQYANERLWGAYRGVSVAPECFQSALMALEYWLLEKAKRGDADLEAVLLELLHRSNNVAITGVVASVAAADPAKAGQAAYALLTCQHLLIFSEQELVDLNLAVMSINSWNRLSIPFRYQPEPE
jgi:hypothetical protein